jgi:hypothetical protein
MALSRRPGRSRPIRLFLISMFAVPLVSLVALYAYAASTTIANAVVDQKYNQGVKIIAAGFGELTKGLPQEQAATYVWLSTGRRVPNASMLAARKVVDAGFLAAKNVIRPVQDAETPHARAAQDALFAALGQLGKTRAAVHDQPAGRVRGLQQPGRRPVAVLFLLEQQGRLVHRRLDRRHRHVLRHPDGRQGGHARRRRAGQRRPDERGRPPGVHGQRGHQALPDEHGHRRADP